MLGYKTRLHSRKTTEPRMGLRSGAADGTSDWTRAWHWFPNIAKKNLWIVWHGKQKQIVIYPLCLICRVIPKQTENRFCQFPNGGDAWKYHNWPKLIWTEHQSVWQHLFGNTVGERIRHVIWWDLGNLSLKIPYIYIYICIYVYMYIGI